MKRLALIPLVIAFATSAVGCKSLLKKRQTTEDAASASAVAVTPPPAAPPSVVAAPAPAPVADLDVPTPEDFEDAAFEKITAKNVDAELARLKKEIAP